MNLILGVGATTRRYQNCVLRTTELAARQLPRKAGFVGPRGARRDARQVCQACVGATTRASTERHR